ncbi:MAG: M28 family metallopeptidase [Blastocatellia bacterium]
MNGSGRGMSYRIAFACIALMLGLSGAGHAQESAAPVAREAGSAGVPRLSTDEEIRAEFEAVPCKNKERLAAVKALFERMGAAPGEIVIEKKGGVENLLIRKPAAVETAEKIVIGAHYDKTGDGCGAIDNWTGIVAIAHLYRTLKDTPMKKTLVFVAFGREEEGLVGSTQLAGAIRKEQLMEYCAMVNVDSLGLAMPQVADNMSVPSLEALAATVAREMEMPYAHADLPNGDSDSTSFNRRKIPALTIHGLSKDWPKILHGRNDQVARIDMAGVYLGYRLAASMVTRIDAADCHAFREVKTKKEKKESKEKR